MDNFKKVGLVLASFVVCTSAQAVDIVTNEDMTLSFGGYVKAEAVSNMPDVGDSSIESTARQSRINFKTTKMIEGKKVTGFIEGDFYGNFGGGPELRLRHAFVSFDKFTVGQTWNGQFHAAIPQDNELIDFFGTGFGTIAGGSNIRPELVVHYASNGFRLTAQDPVYSDADIPDLVAGYTGKASNLSYNIAATARDVKNGTDSDMGFGISLTGKLPISPQGSLHAGVFTGEGMGVYSSVCSSGGDCDAENGKLVSQTGYSVGYKHNFNSKLRGNLRYGEVKVDDNADTTQKLTAANLIYKYTPEIDFGIEWRDRSGDNFPGHRPEGQQVELMAQYSF